MNFTKIKQLEDLKIRSNSLELTLNNKRKKLKKDFITTTLINFKIYFENKGFVVTNKEYTSIAIYNEYKVSIECSTENDNFLGYLAVYKLLLNAKNYKVIINKIGTKISISTSFSSVPNNEEDKLDYEISETEKNIESMEKSISDNAEIKLGYMISDENKRASRSDKKYFENIGELLDFIN